MQPMQLCNVCNDDCIGGDFVYLCCRMRPDLCRSHCILDCIVAGTTTTIVNESAAFLSMQSNYAMYAMTA
jgi:hypothetical protein